MKNEIIKAENNLPTNLEDIAKFVLIGKEKLISVKAEIRAMKNLKVAEEVYKQKEVEAKELGGALLLAKVRIGELLKDIPKEAGRPKKISDSAVTNLTKQEKAEKLGFSKKETSRFQQLADNKEIVEGVIESSEDIPTQTECLKKIQDLKKAEKKQDLESKKAKILKQTKNSIESNRPEVWNESYETWLPKMGYCDLLLTDPPYSTDVDNIAEFVSNWLYKALDKVKDTGAAYICIGAYPEEVKSYLNAKIPEHIKLEQILVWEYKNTLGNNPRNKYKLNYQNILFYKGIHNNYFDCPITNEQWAVQSINAPDGRQADRYHSWQKPIELAERLIRHSTKGNAIVLDPFCCTGTFVIASNKLSRKGFGCDINMDNLRISIERGCKLNE